MYKQLPSIYIASDCIIFGLENGVIKLLVVKRPIAPLKDRWSLIGTFLKKSENSFDAAKRVLLQATGLKDIFLDQLFAYTDVDRDPGARCVSIAHYALIRIEDYHNAAVKLSGAAWFALQDVPPLIFDHDRMVQDALLRLREQAKYTPVAFELLPSRFTMKALQNFYEALYQQAFDTANFRKKVLTYPFLIKTHQKVKDTSKKGSFLYRFDQKRYEQLQAQELNIRFV